MFVIPAGFDSSRGFRINKLVFKCMSKAGQNYEKYETMSLSTTDGVINGKNQLFLNDRDQVGLNAS